MVATTVFAACGGPALLVDDPTTVLPQSEHGLTFIEHHVAGLRVLETVIGAEFSTTARLPVIVSIHGRGDRARLPAGGFANIDRPVRLLLPEAPDPLGDGFTWAPVSVTEHQPQVLATALGRNADRIAAVLTWVTQARQVAGLPIVTGFSQGGMLTYALAVRHPTLVGYAVPVAGMMPLELVPRRMSSLDALPSIAAINGTADPIVQVGFTRRTIRRLRSLGFNVDSLEIEGVRHVYTTAIAAAVHERIERALAADAARTPAALLRFARGVGVGG